MENNYCNFCGSSGGNFPIHGILVCVNCRCGLPEDEQDEQDLFDEDFDHARHSVYVKDIIADLLIQA